MTARLTWPWFAALPAVWAAHIGTLYVVQSLHCLEGLLSGDVLGVPAIRLASVLITLGAEAFAVICGLRMLAAHRRADDEATAYASLAGAVVSAMLAVYLVWALVPAISYPTCPG